MGVQTGLSSAHVQVPFFEAIQPMETVFFHLTNIAVLAVLVVLVIGLFVMMRGKSPNLSQKLMRWRVGLQFAAIMMVLAYVLARQYF